ncbi:class Ib ribonucleoside-diphosphate reductase assembly flavoprotein NrdI [Olivibacter domesticus]|uniref:Protein involved in ribonucleotide reduction n=1 Tax=Olivibacter domesticus TaxID=407022 RepID=A0A1H7QA81_OLID1|nr:class Ib ribonucleoside-diphosphate reductase assembly flavoprotein NrdI [Olivibacter domesticus]SEL44786.1 protein involved in ribonucleotide reduction [Olivibacter domesticus]
MQDWIYYDSKTGNVARFADKLEIATGWCIRRISEDMSIANPGHLITFTTGKGEIPSSTDKFMQHNHELIKTVSASGNRNWGQNFGKAADTIANLYQLPLLFKFELSGSMSDVRQFINKINEYHEYHSNEKSLHCEEVDIAQ